MINALSAAVLSPAGIAIISVEAVALAILLSVLTVLVVKMVKLQRLPKDEYAVNGEISADEITEADNAEPAAALSEQLEQTAKEEPVVLSKTKAEDITSQETAEAKTVRNASEKENVENAEVSAPREKIKDAEEEKITFSGKMDEASEDIKGYYDALKSELLSYKGIHSRVTIGGDYFRIPGKQLAKVILIGTTLRLALALDPNDFDYKIYHQHDRGGMKKYADTPMFVKVQSKLGLERAKGLIAVMAEKNGVKKSKR